MYELTLSVSACLRADTHVDVAWAVDAHGFGSWDKSEALALTPGGGRIGGVLSGALNDQLADLANQGIRDRLVDLEVGEVDATLAGLVSGGDARCLMVSADGLPAELWQLLRDRQPVCLVSRLDADRRVTGTELFGRETIADAGENAAALFGHGVSDMIVSGDAVVTVLWPIPKLLIVGGGPIAEAIQANAALLGWRTQVLNQRSAATGAIAALAVLDSLVVIGHDDELAGSALAAALDGEVGYIGAVGAPRRQQALAEWLAYRGITDLDRIHGPAGLAIGASTPAEIAVSVLAEVLAARSGADVGVPRPASKIG